MAWSGALANQTSHTAWLGSSRSRQQQPHVVIRATSPLGQPRTGASGGQQQSGGQRQRRQSHVRALQEGGPSLPDLELPKFQPFTPQNALQQAMLRYRFQREVGPDGQVLLVTALNSAWIAAGADLLTESFAVSLGAAPYTNFLRRQVKAYLEQHSRLPPKAVVLMALVLPADVAAAEGEVEAAVGAAAAAVVAAAVESSSSSGTTPTGEPAGSSSSSSEGDPSGSPPAALPAWQPLADVVGDLGDGMARLSTLYNDMSASANASSSDEEEEQQQQEPLGPGTGAVLAGVVELSFSSSTRTNYVTLNPPEDRPYLCNMAIAEALRGRGYGYLLLQAAEELVSELGENEVFLHLRVQDLPAAGLYNKSRFEEVAADNFLVRLIGLDQRRLMRKRLPKTPKAQQPAAAQEQAAAAAPMPPKMQLNK